MLTLWLQDGEKRAPSDTQTLIPASPKFALATQSARARCELLNKLQMSTNEQTSSSTVTNDIQLWSSLVKPTAWSDVRSLEGSKAVKLETRVACGVVVGIGKKTDACGVGRSECGHEYEMLRRVIFEQNDLVFHGQIGKWMQVLGPFNHQQQCCSTDFVPETRAAH